MIIPRSDGLSMRVACFPEPGGDLRGSKRRSFIVGAESTIGIFPTEDDGKQFDVRSNVGAIV